MSNHYSCDVVWYLSLETKTLCSLCSLEVVLLEANPNLGKQGEVVTVSAGYWRNYLGPMGKAKLATQAILKWVIVFNELAPLFQTKPSTTVCVQE